MRPRSMTGFGRGEISANDRVWVAEVRTVNHRYLDQRVVMPRAFSALEDRVRKMIASNHDRGRVDVTLQCMSDADTGTKLSVNVDLARQYHSCLRKIKNELALEAPIQMRDILTQRDIISLQEGRHCIFCRRIWILLFTCLRMIRICTSRTTVTAYSKD